MNYVTTLELMELLKVSKRTIVYWREQGMPFKKINRLVRFDLDEVKKWIDKRSKEATNENM